MLSRTRSVAVLFLAAAIVLAGCITMNVRADLHRDKSMDLEVGVESDTNLVLNAFKQSFQERYGNSTGVLSEGDTSFSYSWERVRIPEIDTPGNGSDAVIMEAFNLSEEYDFPFSYRYRLELESEGSGFGNYSGTDSLGGSLGGSSFGINYYIRPFGEITATNGVRTDDGYVKFDMMKEETYFLEFTDMAWNSIFTGEACREEWTCTEWSSCQDGVRMRDCTASSMCDSYITRPKVQEECGSALETDSESLFGDSLGNESDLFGDLSTESESMSGTGNASQGLDG